MNQASSESIGGKPQGNFSELFRLQWKLALREPYGFGLGLALPGGFMVVFGIISDYSPGIDSLSIIEVWLPTIIVICIFTIGMYGIPITLVRDREIGWLRRISTTPVSPASLLFAQVVINVIIAAVGISIIVSGSIYIFKASLTIDFFYFAISLLLSGWVMFSLGMMVAALATNQRILRGISGALFFPLLLLGGLWFSPLEVGDPLRTIMWYSPIGAGARSILYSNYNMFPPYMELVAMTVYAAIFTYIAARYFKWE